MEKLRTFLAGRKQSDFAKSLGISAPYLSQILNGDRRPSFDLMIKIESATGRAVPVDAWRSPSTGEAA